MLWRTLLFILCVCVCVGVTFFVFCSCLRGWRMGLDGLKQCWEDRETIAASPLPSCSSRLLHRCRGGWEGCREVYRRLSLTISKLAQSEGERSTYFKRAAAAKQGKVLQESCCCSRVAPLRLAVSRRTRYHELPETQKQRPLLAWPQRFRCFPSSTARGSAGAQVRWIDQVFPVPSASWKAKRLPPACSSAEFSKCREGAGFPPRDLEE
mmetsp:Transcript_9100/g.20171  ORF Transcript_9100/g.20171 Transcript_9100/m.20171 type:complete len:209 (-) Transcript_9100:975-1601(-)